MDPVAVVSGDCFEINLTGILQALLNYLCTFFQGQSQILSIHLLVYFSLAGSPGFHKECQDLHPSSVKNFPSHTSSNLRNGRHAVK